jgi:hypothetical protein
LRDLTFKEPVTGKKTWNDRGEGFGEAKEVLLEDGADVTVAPGFVLNGGTITLKRAQLKLAGTPTQPVVFRNVSINGVLGALVQAENAVLENCTFAKTGGWFSMHSSRWEFSESMLYRCKFSGLSRVDYGVQMKNCAWVEGTMPQRRVERTQDLGGAFSSPWDSMTSSLFLRSKVAVSAIWMSRNCNFDSCSSGAEDFVSKTGIAVPLYVPEGDPVGWQVREWTAEGDVGEVQFGFSRKAFEVKAPGILWALLPVDLPPAQGQRGE